MTSMYTLTQEARLLVAAIAGETIDPETGEVVEKKDVRAAFEALQGTVEERVQLCMRVAAECEGDRDKCRAEAKRLNALASEKDAEAGRILAVVLEVMLESLTTSVGGTHPVKVVRNPGSVKITDEKSLPAEYWRHPPAPAKEPDKKALTPLLKPPPKGQGLEIPGAQWALGDFRLDRG